MAIHTHKTTAKLLAIRTNPAFPSLFEGDVEYTEYEQINTTVATPFGNQQGTATVLVSPKKVVTFPNFIAEEVVKGEPYVYPNVPLLESILNGGAVVELAMEEDLNGVKTGEIHPKYIGKTP